MPKPFSNLRHAMDDNDIDQSYIARRILRNPRYVSERMCAYKPFTLNEAYTIMKILNIPHDQLHVYFPPNGQNEPGCSRGQRPAP